jgi:starch synthase
VQFTPVTEPALREAIRRTISLYQQPKVWKRIQRRGMKAEVSWETSAERYADLYSSLLGRTGKNDD